MKLMPPGRRKGDFALVSMLLIAAFTLGAHALHIPQDGVDTATWAIVGICASFMGGNVGEHAFKKPTPPGAA